MATRKSRREALEAIRQAHLAHPCQKCGAGVGEVCTMPSGKRAGTFHESRYRAALSDANEAVDRFRPRPEATK